MSTSFKLISLDAEGAVELRHAGGGLLLRYVYRPQTPLTESPRPYAHPVQTLRGDLLTLFRPNDHPWHHALSFTLTSVSGHNFWGGGSYRKEDGYKYRGDQGTQEHEAWIEKSASRLAHTLLWRVGAGERILLREERSLSFSQVSDHAWSLRWQGSLKNVSGETLQLGHYHSTHGLTGSHYSGLQFRAARALLDDHGDATIRIVGEGDLQGEAAVHGAPLSWMEWYGQKDESLHRVSIRFDNAGQRLHGFVRRNYPLASFPLNYAEDQALAPEQTLSVDHTLTFSDL
ncbi:MAG TPA: PmoA family protein [Opitutaceae bacterium]|nr:PmoA family protein [Opitutaceae bacterium]